MNICTNPCVRSIHDIHHGELTTIFTTALFAASIHSWMRMEIKDDPLKTRSPLSTAGKLRLTSPRRRSAALVIVLAAALGALPPLYVWAVRSMLRRNLGTCETPA
jgi:hypothetical protein